MKLVKIFHQNFHDMDRWYEYQLLTDEQAEHYRNSLLNYPSDLKITYYDDDNQPTDEVTVTDCVNMLDNAREVTEDEVAILEKLVPEVIKKVSDNNDIAGYIEQFEDMV
jgi:hypothetical protein